MFNVMVAVVILLLSAMVGSIESVGLALTIPSPTNAITGQNLNIASPMPLFGLPNQINIMFLEIGFLVFSGGSIQVGQSGSVSCSASYGDVPSSDFPVINAHLAEYGVSGFITTYAFLMRWTYASLPTLESNTLFATNGAQTYYSVWHPGASNATIDGLSFGVGSAGGYIPYFPDNQTIYVIQIDLANFTQLFLPTTTTTNIPISGSTQVVTSTTTTTSSSVMPPGNTATKVFSSPDTLMLLIVALLFPTIAASSFAL